MDCFFLAVRIPENSQCLDEEVYKSFLTLSSRVMKWRECVWILDMGFCFSYWRVRAEILSRSSTLSVYDHLLQIWKQSMLEILRKFSKQDEFFSEKSLQAVLSFHPWNALLLLEHMQVRSLFGFLDATKSLAKAQIKETGWDLWQNALQTLADHYEGVDSKSKVQKFRLSIRKWIDSMSNLCVKKPADLIGTDVSAIKRRYGCYVAQAWEWSYETAPAGGLFASFVQETRINAFPWKSFKAQSEIFVQRHLDFSPSDWMACELYLQEDFDRIANHSQWNEQARISEIEWTIRYADVDDLKMILRFRHPYNPLVNRGSHKAALAQACYAYASSKKEEVEDLFLSSRMMISWELRVKKVFYLSSHVSQLFESSVDPKDKELLDLENQLPIPLEEYWLFPDWFVEDSFKATAMDKNLESASCLEWKKKEYLTTAMCRPMYLFEPSNAEDLQGQTQDFHSIYLQEELMQKWWLHTSYLDEEALYRSTYFYRAIDAKSVQFWVEGNSSSSTLKIRGVYG